MRNALDRPTGRTSHMRFAEEPAAPEAARRRRPSLEGSEGPHRSVSATERHAEGRGSTRREFPQ